MRIWLIAVGRLKAGPEQALVRHYAGRITWPFEMREVEEKRPLSAGELREREGALLLAALPKGSTVVALDARGKALTSEAFAAEIARWREGGLADLAFVIGGAGGLSEAVRRRAVRVLSLGPMTWPHLLVRGMLLEQLYRAQQILAGHPYHRA
jgi:23S rRNA (pseudouridine1915-N3)-methyltransferase